MWVQTSCKIYINQNSYLDYSLITYKFSDNREKYLGMGETASALGCMMGPAIGGLLFTTFGYAGAFLVFGLLMGVAGILS